MYTVNKIAVEPFPDKSVKTKVHGEGKYGVSEIANAKNTLVRLKVLAEAKRTAPSQINDWIAPLQVYKDSYVWVRASDYSSPWGKEIFTGVLGEPFVLIPIDRVELFENPTRPE